MNRTVRLDLSNAAAQAAVAGQVVLALAVACGAGPLAGERLRRSVEAAAAVATGRLAVDAVAERGSLHLAFEASPDDGWADRALPILHGHDAVRTASGLSIDVLRPSLQRTSDV
jgi:hypothetical protein